MLRPKLQVALDAIGQYAMQSKMDTMAKLALRTALGMFSGKLMDADENELRKAFNLMARIMNDVANDDVSDDSLRDTIASVMKDSVKTNEPAGVVSTT